MGIKGAGSGVKKNRMIVEKQIAAIDSVIDYLKAEYGFLPTYDMIAQKMGITISMAHTRMQAAIKRGMLDKKTAAHYLKKSHKG